MKPWTVIVLFAACLCGAQVQAEDDHEIARRAVERGELLPLAKILSSVERTYPGRVLEVELEREKGRYLYEIEVLLPDGRVVELTYDGKSGELLESEVDDD
jgi:uncharacterized membrane protein YkoI